LRFQGQYQDGETDLYYNYHRYYDPDTGRYLTPDPLGLHGGENQFQYAPSPTAWVDPWGNKRRKAQEGAPTHAGNRVKRINGRMPQNSCFAGKTMVGQDLPEEIRGKYPHGVPFNMLGFADFSRYALKNIDVGTFTTDARDFRAANNASFGKGNKFGSSGRIVIRGESYTWHHTQHDGKLQLIPADIHDAAKHTGGAAVCGTRRK
jgi:RHS repeat-associated protein